MRPQQQNRRMRGRGGNNNRKGPNPLTRSYESNGPDVKIRGSAQQIADKYTALARDAQSAGDRVIAENYLQHAEHYNRIIAAAQAQIPQQQRDRSEDADFDEDERDETESHAQPRERERAQQVTQQINGHGPQPVIEGTPAEVAYQEEAIPQPAPANGNGGDGEPEAAARAAAGEEEQPAPRRARRPRRPRNQDDAPKAEAAAEPAAQD